MQFLLTRNKIRRELLDEYSNSLNTEAEWHAEAMKAYRARIRRIKSKRTLLDMLKHANYIRYFNLAVKYKLI